MIRPNILPDEEIDELEGTILSADDFVERVTKRDDIYEVEDKNVLYKILGICLIVGLFLTWQFSKIDLTVIKTGGFTIRSPQESLTDSIAYDVTSETRYDQLAPMYALLDYPFMYYYQYPLPTPKAIEAPSFICILPPSGDMRTNSVKDAVSLESLLNLSLGEIH